LIENSDGSARKALVLLNQIIDLDNDEDKLEAIKATTAEVQGTIIAKALFNPHTKWFAMSKVLKESANEDPEAIRWMVLGYAKAVLLGGGKLSGRAYLVISSFEDHFYDSKWGGLVARCYEIVVGARD